MGIAVVLAHNDWGGVEEDEEGKPIIFHPRNAVEKCNKRCVWLFISNFYLTSSSRLSQHNIILNGMVDTYNLIL